MLLIDGVSAEIEGVEVLRGARLELGHGATVALIGRNGAGKSTLLRIIARAEAPNRGRVRSSVRLSWPMGFKGGFQSSMSGVDNVRFIARIYGVDREIRVVASLHEDSRPSDGERLLDLLEDDGLGQQVALRAVTGAAVEGAEVAVGDADVRVVEIAVDDERDSIGVGAPSTELIGDSADREQVLPTALRA
jgi:energy-coupling factor transporter ATP-binding protein EcfA2